MNPRLALMFVGAVLVLVANLVGEDSDVSRIAQANAGAGEAAAPDDAGNPDGFADDSEVGPLLDPEEYDESVQQAARMAAAVPDQPEIGEFSPDDAEVADTTRLAMSDRAVGPLSKFAWLPVRDTSGLQPGEVRVDFNPRLR